MTSPKILIAFYSTYGTNLGIAQTMADAAKAAGAEVRLRRFAETAPKEVVEGQEAWAATLEKLQSVETISHDDMRWADGYLFSVPTRYGMPPSQMSSFTDTVGPLWQDGVMVGKTFSATTTAQTEHGGQEGTVLALYRMAIHWGTIIVAPGYGDPVKFEDGGNPYGHSSKAGESGHAASLAYQARRLVEVTAKLIA